MIRIEKKKIIRIQIIITILVIILGTLLHFTHEFSGENQIVGLFSAVNESTWEHLKLSFFPIVIFGIIGYFFLKNAGVNNYIEAQTIAAIFSMIFITVVFYTYTGIIGTNYFIIDILTFILAIILSEWIAYKIMTKENFSTNATKTIAIVSLIAVTLMFFVFTFNPPNIALFEPPTF